MYPFIETIRIEDGQVYNLAYHAERMNRTRTAFWKDVELIDMHDMISPQSLSGTQKCRVVYGQKIEEITYAPYQMRNIQTLRLIDADGIDYSYKSSDRNALNLLFDQRGNADDILIVKNGYLTDTSIANIALCDDSGSWFTPAHPLLRGTKRAELLDKNRIIEREIRATELGKYSHIMLFNAMIDWNKIVLPICDNSSQHFF